MQANGFRLVLDEEEEAGIERWLLDLQDGNEWTYFIRSGQFVKIGTSRSVRRRLYTVRVGTPEGARLIGMAMGGADREKLIHAHLADFHHRGEWFRLHRKVISHMRGQGVWPGAFKYGDVGKDGAPIRFDPWYFPLTDKLFTSSPEVVLQYHRRKMAARSRDGV